MISDAHEGLKQAISTVLSGTTWPRCRVPFMRNLLATVPHGAREAIAAIVRTIFAQPDHASAMSQLRKVADGLRPRFPQTARLLEDAAEDILAYRHLPLEHQRQLHSTNPLKRLNKEIRSCISQNRPCYPQRNITVELGVPRAVNLSHAAGAQR